MSSRQFNWLFASVGIALVWIVFLAVLATCPGTATAQSATSIAPPAVENYGGVVVNQTITLAGNDFYQHFVLAWRDRELSERYTVSVHELPSPRWGSRVWIEHRQSRVFQAQLPAARAAIRTISTQAVEAAYQRIADAEVERLLFRNADIGPDEI